MLVAFQRWVRRSLSYIRWFPELKFKQKHKRRENQFQTILDFITHGTINVQIILYLVSHLFETYLFNLLRHLFIWSILTPHKGKPSLESSCLVLRRAIYVLIELCGRDSELLAKCSNGSGLFFLRCGPAERSPPPLNNHLGQHSSERSLPHGYCMLTGMPCWLKQKGHVERKKAELLSCGEQVLHHSGSYDMLLPFPPKSPGNTSEGWSQTS